MHCAVGYSLHFSPDCEGPDCRENGAQWDTGYSLELHAPATAHLNSYKFIIWTSAKRLPDTPKLSFAVFCHV
jgi:hypothetical protein